MLSTSRAEIDRAQGLARSFQFQDALQVALDVLDRDADCIDAWILAAKVLLATGRAERALEAASNAIARAPDDARGHYVLGRVLKGQGNLGAAASSYARAIELNPASPEMLNSLGVTLRALGRIEHAVAVYRAALALRPDYPEVNRNLANALSALGEEQEALKLADIAQSRLALEVDRLANEIDALVAAGKMPEALHASREALRMMPESARLWMNAGDLLLRENVINDAFRHYEEAARLEPTYLDALDACRLLAVAYGLKDPIARYSAAVRAIRPSTEIDVAERLSLPAIQRDADSIRASRAAYEAALDELLGSGIRITHRNTPAAIAVSAFYLAYHGECDRYLQVKAARLFTTTMPELNFVAPHCVDPQPPSGRIRVGFISRFLYEHSIGKTTRGLVAELSREKFVVVVIRIGASRADPIAQAIDAAADEVVSLNDDLGQMREQIAGLRLDVLFYQDIGMEQISYFLALGRLAPIQCVSFGHPNTTGIATMDYFVSNDRFEVAGAEDHYSERLFLLKDLPTLAYYYRPERVAHRMERETFGLGGDHTIYLCAQTLFKLHPDIDPIVAGILRGDPRGRVVFICGQLEEWTVLLRARFAATMPDVAERIVFMDRVNGPAFLELLRVSDVALDTLHFNGMNSSLEAFAVGTPVVTLPGRLQRGRHTYGMYQAMGIDDCIARDAADYVAIALRLGLDPGYRAEISRRIDERSGVLYESRRVIDEFERFFETAVAERFGASPEALPAALVPAASGPEPGATLLRAAMRPKEFD